MKVAGQWEALGASTTAGPVGPPVVTILMSRASPELDLDEVLLAQKQ